MATINTKYFVDDEANVNFYEGCKVKGKYPKINPLKIDNCFHLRDLLKHIDDDNTYRPKQSDLYTKMKMERTDHYIPVHRTYAFLEDHGCELVGANNGPCYAILGSAIDIKLAQLKYSKMSSSDEVEFGPILAIAQKVMFTFVKDCELIGYLEPPTCFIEYIDGDTKIVRVDEVLKYLKKLDNALLYLMRYYQDFDMLSAYVQIQNMEVEPE